MNNLAIIPARGGSKRIPRKNIREFANKPMIAHSIEAALQSGMFNRVVVSTDDEEIADISRSYGAEVPFVRPLNLSGDYTGTAEVLQHAIHWVNEHNYYPDAVCCIYATAPLIQVEDIKKGWDILNSESWNFVFSATKFGYSIFRSFKKMNDSKGLEMFFPEHSQTRSQDLPEAMHDAGQFYWGQTNAWLNGLRVFERWSTIIELPRWRVQDIDTMEDWKQAEIIYQLLNKNSKTTTEHGV